MSSTGRIKFEERSNSKRRKLEKQVTDWSDVPCDIVECIIGHSSWSDRIRIRAVCKSWSVPNLHIPTLDIDIVPWTMTEFSVSGLIDPFGRQYPMKVSKECDIFRDAKPRASAYGWVLFYVSWSFYLYSPFTTEVIKFPDEYVQYEVATFSLNATSPKSFVFLLRVNCYGKVCVKLCSPGDDSWKYFEFNSGFDRTNRAVQAAFVDGVFYCVFSRGQLGAFNVELEEWTILTARLPHYRFHYAKLVVSDSDLLLWNRSVAGGWYIFKFDFSETRWVYQSDLNNRVLFVGCTSFSVPAVGEISQLANTIFYCDPRYPSIEHYGSTSLSSRNESVVYREARRAMTWIQPPLGGIWRANELINAA